MYIKIVPQSTSSSSGAWHLIEALRNVIVAGEDIQNQNSTYINTALSFQTGTAPTANQYTVYSNTTISGMTYQGGSTNAYTTSTSNVNRGRFAFYKKHYAYGQATGFAAQRVVDVIYGEMKYNNTSSSSYPAWDWGLRCNMRAQSYAGLNAPRDDYDHTWGNEVTSSSTSFGVNAVVGGDGLDNLGEIHVILNDTTFAMFARSAGSDTSRDHGMFVVNDLEFNSSYDTYTYTGNNDLCPTHCVWAFTQNTLDDPLQSLSPHSRFGVAGNYMTKDGTTGTHVNSDASYQYHYGGRADHPGDYASIQPQGRETIDPLFGPNGENIHQLVPVMYMGHSDPTDRLGDPRRGRMMNFYRTSDNAFQDGDVLIDGTTRYRVFRGHKCGTQDYSTGQQVACYAFPEDNVPYS